MSFLLYCGIITIKKEEKVIKNQSYGWIKFFSVLFPIIGIVFYFIEVDKNEKKARACLSGIIISFILSIFVAIISLIVYTSVMNDLQAEYNDEIYYTEETDDIKLDENTLDGEELVQ